MPTSPPTFNRSAGKLLLPTVAKFDVRADSKLADRLVLPFWAILLSASFLIACGSGNGGSTSPPPPSPSDVQLAVTISGSGSVSSSPAGINCSSGTCSASFQSGTAVTLTGAPASGFALSSWMGGCAGNKTTCELTLNNDAAVTALFDSTTPRDLSAINHIVFMLQENRGMDHYFGHLPDYWQANKDKFPHATNGTTFAAEPPDAFNLTNDGLPITAFHLNTVCLENPSPAWNESHVDWNRNNPYSVEYKGDGFVHTAAGQTNVSGPFAGQPYFDSTGKRVMGYYTDRELNYYYFMASAFGTSDQWFAPVMTRTQPNRMYLLAGTSAGRVYPQPLGSGALPNKTIFQVLDEQGISWKIYTSDNSPSYLSMFQYFSAPGVQSKIISANPNYFDDVANGTLPQVIMIEGGYASGLDEHPTGDDSAPQGSNVQTGAAYVSTLINALMNSPSWKDSVFILTWDEGGGFYDHVAPLQTVSPDDVKPSDLRSGDICTTNTGPTCDFVYTGYRVPLIVVSPWTKNVVSHTGADFTAILKLIEKRFGLDPLTKRDAIQIDMSEFFDFEHVPWSAPPQPPKQLRTSPCYVNSLP